MRKRRLNAAEWDGAHTRATRYGALQSVSYAIDHGIPHAERSAPMVPRPRIHHAPPCLPTSHSMPNDGHGFLPPAYTQCAHAVGRCAKTMPHEGDCFLASACSGHHAERITATTQLMPILCGRGAVCTTHKLLYSSMPPRHALRVVQGRGVRNSMGFRSRVGHALLRHRVCAHMRLCGLCQVSIARGSRGTTMGRAHVSPYTRYKRKVNMRCPPCNAIGAMPCPVRWPWAMSSTVKKDHVHARTS